MKEEVFVEPAASRPPSLLRRVSWGAIFAGLLVTMVIQLMLTLLGVGIGAATIDPLKEQNPAEGLATGSAIWLIGSALISVFIGSCIAGRLSGAPRRADGLLHGVVTWSAATVLTVLFLVTAAGTILGGTGALLSRAIGAGAGAAEKSGGLDQNAMASLENKVKQSVPGADALLPPTGRETDLASPPGELTAMAQNNKELAAALAKMEKNGGAAKSPADRDAVIQMLTKQGMEQERASQLVTQWDAQMQQTKQQAEQKAREVGDVAAKGTSKAALWGFAALALELAIAAWGGWAGASSLARGRRVETVASPA
jgi:hypothetical protein